MKYYKNQPAPKNDAVVYIITQHVLFNANWNDDKFWSQMIASWYGPEVARMQGE